MNDYTRNFIIRLKTERDDMSEYRIMNDINSTHDDLEIIHIECGRVFNIKARNFLYGRQGCSECNSNFKRQNEISEEIDDYFKSINLEPLDSYVNSKTPISIRCLKCNDVFTSKYSDIKYKGTGCPNCAGNKKLTIEIVSERISEVEGYLCHSKEYVNVHTKLDISHTCGFKFQMNYNNFRNGQRCPICSRSNSSGGLSKAVIDIINILTEEEIEFEREKRFEEHSKNGYRYDFFIPSMNLILEYHGKQHRKYEKRGYFTKEVVNEIQRIDKIKRKFILNKTEYEYLEISDLEDHVKIINDLIHKYKKI